MATLGRWTGGTTSLIPTTSWAAPNGLFPTQQRNDGSAYSFASSTSTLTLPSSGLADGYLLVAHFEFEDTSNGRHNPSGQFVQASGTGNFVGGPTGGYNRDTSEDRSFVRCWAFVDSPSASSTYQFQWKRDSDAPTGGTVQSSFEVIPLYYSNHGVYSSSVAALYGGTTPNQVTGWTAVNESNTAAIELVSNVVTVKGDNKRYLILGSQYFEARGSNRTQRWHGLEIDNAQENAAKGYSYSRDASNDRTGQMFTWLLETATANITIEQTCYRGDGVAAGQGGGNLDGFTPTSGDHAFVVLELNDNAEVFRSENTAKSGDLNVTGPVDMSCCPTAGIAFNDSASWTRSSDTAMNAEVAMDALIGANISAAQEVVSTTSRWTSRAHVTVNGTEDNDTRHGNYARNNQSSADTFGWSANLLSFVALSLNDDVGCSIQELAGGEDGGRFETQIGWNGFWGVNLDTLESGTSGQTLTAPLYSDPDTFPAPTVTVGAVALTAPLYVDPDTFPGPTITPITDLDAPLYVDPDAFPGQTVEPGAVTVEPPLYIDPDIFPGQTVEPGAVTLTPGLFVDPDTFPAHSIDQTTTLVALLYIDPDAFPAPTVTVGPVELAPGLYVDPDSFPTQVLTQGLELLPDLYVDLDSFPGQAVTVGAVTITAPLYVDPDTFYTHTVGEVVEGYVEHANRVRALQQVRRSIL